MIIVKIFEESTEIENLTYTVSFDSCRRRLKLYFSGLEKVKERILSGEIISIPYLTLQKDRRVEEKKVENGRRKTDILK